MKTYLLAFLLVVPGCFGWAFVDSGNDAAHAKNDAPRCAQWCKAHGGVSFEDATNRQCGCQLDGERFIYSEWPQ